MTNIPPPFEPRGGGGTTIDHPAERARARSQLIQLIARQLVQQFIQDQVPRHESLPLRPLQH